MFTKTSAASAYFRSLVVVFQLVTMHEAFRADLAITQLYTNNRQVTWGDHPCTSMMPHTFVKWRFPEMGVPLNHPIKGDFHGFSTVNHPFGGTPIDYGNPCEFPSKNGYLP